MTTVGVYDPKLSRVDALHMPSYNYHYPHFKRKQLCQYFDCYRKTRRPDFRRVEAERMRQQCQCLQHDIAATPGTTLRDRKLTSSHYPMDDLSENKLPPVVPAAHPPDPNTRPRLCPHEYARWRYDTTPVVTTEARSDWNHFLDRYPERFDIQLPLEETGDGALPYYDGGYALRFLRPHMTRGLGVEPWREKLFPPSVWKSGPATDSPYRDIRVTYDLKGQ